MISKTSAAMIMANKKGYLVNDDGKTIIGPNRELSITNRPDGYRYFSVRGIGNRVYKIFVHRMQAYKKYGYTSLIPGVQVRHLDGDNANNHIDNIEIGFSHDNQMDKPEHVRKSVAIKASSKIRRFSDEEVESILADRKLGMKYNELCKKYDTSKSTLSYLFNFAMYSGKDPSKHRKQKPLYYK